MGLIIYIIYAQDLDAKVLCMMNIYDISCKQSKLINRI